MTRQLRVWMPIVVGLLTLATAAEVRAQDDDPAEEAEFTEGRPVRNKVLYRSTRFEASPLLGITLGDAYLRNGVAGVNLAYHLTNEISIGLNAGYGVLHPETNLTANMKARLRANNQQRLEQLTLSYVQWLAGIEFMYVPIFGKFSMMNSLIAQYDFHLIGGFTMVGRSACSLPSCPSGGSGIDTDLSGALPAGTVGIGMRLFVGEAYAINVQVRDHLYSRAEISAGDADSQFANNILLSLGFSFFLPQDVKISR